MWYNSHHLILFLNSDLGSSLTNLTILWLPRCGLEDLDGISALAHLEACENTHTHIYIYEWMNSISAYSLCILSLLFIYIYIY